MIQINCQQTYFIADAHLGAKNLDDNHRREQIILEFLNHIKRDNSTLFIVGDLFDFWFEYNKVIPKEHFKVICKLYELKSENMEIFHVAGNHDFWIGNFLKNSLEIEHFENSVEVDISGKKFFIAHGDGLKQKDKGYRFLKKILRNKINIKLYKSLHPDFGIPFAKKVSRTSRKYTTNKKYGSDDEYFDFAKKKFSSGFDNVILAHTHRPVIEKIESKTFINLGDWINSFTYGYFDGKKLELKKWKTEGK